MSVHLQTGCNQTFLPVRSKWVGSRCKAGSVEHHSTDLGDVNKDTNTSWTTQKAYSCKGNTSKIFIQQWLQISENQLLSDRVWTTNSTTWASDFSIQESSSIEKRAQVFVVVGKIHQINTPDFCEVLKTNSFLFYLRLKNWHQIEI